MLEIMRALAAEPPHPDHGRADGRRSARRSASACTRSIRGLRAAGVATDLHLPRPRRGARAVRPGLRDARRRAGRDRRWRSWTKETLVEAMLGHVAAEAAAAARTIAERGGAPGRGPQRPGQCSETSRSRSAAVRSSASPASSAPVAPSSCARSPAPTAASRAGCSSTARATAVAAHGTERARSRDRARARGPQVAGARPVAERPRRTSR